MRDCERRSRLLPSLITAMLTLAFLVPAGAAIKPRLIVVLPFDALSLPAEERWMGEGVAQISSRGLAQHAAFNQVDPPRLRALGHPEAWGQPAVLQAVRSIKADAAVFGDVIRTGAELVIRPRLIEIKGAGGEPLALEPRSEERRVG